uniref:Uncharacterized protein n=1 Tax=Glossina brevipalpis TaxID=37001 RepID=A0A1A9WJE4_9MUSC
MVLLPFSVNTGEISDVGCILTSFTICVVSLLTTVVVVVVVAAVAIVIDVDSVAVIGDDESVTVGLLIFRIASEDEFLSNFSSASPI